MQKLIIRPISEFFRSDDAPPFTLVMLVVAFFFLYSKVYGIINGHLWATGVYPSDIFTWGSYLVQYLSQLLVSLGVSLITVTVIVHTRNKMAAYTFAIFDGIFSIFYYGNRVGEWWTDGQYGYIGLAICWSAFTALGLYYIAEMFYQQTKEKASKDINNGVNEWKDKCIASNNELFSTKEVLEKVSVGYGEAKDRVSELEDYARKLEEANQGATLEIERLTIELSQKEKTTHRLTLELVNSKHSKSIAGKRAHITALKNRGLQNEADAKQKELDNEIENLTKELK